MKRSSTGEIVAIDESGRPSFSRLQTFSAHADAITFYAFDMPMWKGEDLRMQPLDKRRELLGGLNGSTQQRLEVQSAGVSMAKFVRER